MVISIVSKYRENPPNAENCSDNDLLVVNGPLYPAPDVLHLLEKKASVNPFTAKCRSDLTNMAMDMGDASDLIRDALEYGKYINSQWCISDVKKKMWAACDAYRLKRKEWDHVTHKDLSFSYYVKFAIHKNGTLLLLASCHLS